MINIVFSNPSSTNHFNLKQDHFLSKLTNNTFTCEKHISEITNKFKKEHKFNGMYGESDDNDF